MNKSLTDRWLHSKKKKNYKNSQKKFKQFNEFIIIELEFIINAFIWSAVKSFQPFVRSSCKCIEPDSAVVLNSTIICLHFDDVRLDFEQSFRFLWYQNLITTFSYTNIFISISTYLAHNLCLLLVIQLIIVACFWLRFCFSVDYQNVRVSRLNLKNTKRDMVAFIFQLVESS